MLINSIIESLSNRAWHSAKKSEPAALFPAPYSTHWMNARRANFIETFTSVT